MLRWAANISNQKMYHLFKKTDESILKRYGALMEKAMWHPRSKLPAPEDKMKTILFESFLRALKAHDTQAMCAIPVAYMCLAHFLTRKECKALEAMDKFLLSQEAITEKALLKMANKMERINRIVNTQEVREKICIKSEILKEEWSSYLEELGLS